MPRISRNSLNSNFFHVTVQGINKEHIFYNNSYKDFYIYKMLSNLNRFNVTLISYCIMNNHAHLLLYSEEISNLSRYMKSLNTSYSIFYNHSENRVGYVFRNRFSSQPITNYFYLFNCIRYIHDNPVKAGIVDHAYNYKFSSYNDYMNFSGIMNDNVLKLIALEKADYRNILMSCYDNSLSLKDLNSFILNLNIFIRIFSQINS